MKIYQTLLTDIISDGTQQSNRTGVDAISIPGYMMKFDLRKGFPLLTTKAMPLKSIKGELIGFLRGYTNAADFRDLGCKIWDQNANDPGLPGSPNLWLTNPNREGEDDLGDVYGKMWRKWNTAHWKDQVVEIKIRDGEVDADFTVPGNAKLTPNIVDDLTGRTFVNKTGCEYVVVDKFKTNGKNSRYLVQFTKTTSVVEVSRPNLRLNQVRDPYDMSTFNGKGCIGVVPTVKPEYYTRAYNMWYSMMKRCYDTTLPEYWLYGGRGVYVCQQWRCFANFLNDIRYIPLFGEWKTQPKKFDLDKDYYGGLSYGPTTCVFIPKEYNVVLPHLSGSKYVATHRQTGVTYEFTVQSWGAKKLKIKHPQAISTALSQSPTQSTKDWMFKEVVPSTGCVYRQQLIIDQVGVAVDKIKNDPTNRRIIINGWRPDEFHLMALPPCHVLYQFIVDTTNNLLHLCMYQRSCDSYLGVPFNIASASLFLEIMAHITGRIAGTFTHFLADAHIYVNHLEKVRHQLTLEPRPLPTIKFSDRQFSIDTICPEDIELVGYDPHRWDSSAPMAV